MSVFGFIENFFFISLALVFALVLLLVYHFKNRITTAEKKSESMYGLLTAVVKEIKTLRGMFSLGGVNAPISAETSTNKDPQIELKSKIVPEINIPVLSSEISNNSFSTFAQNSLPEEPNEVITFELSASDNKIVVSDCYEEEDDDTSISNGEENDSDESDADSDAESEPEPESESEQNDMQIFDSVDLTNDLIDDSEKDDKLEVLDIVNILQENIVPTEINIDYIEDKTLHNINLELDLVEIVTQEIDDQQQQVNDEQQQCDDEQQQCDDDHQQVNDDHQQVDDDKPIETLRKAFSIEQLRKMNINQLKTIASQLGISSDVSKMKKPELISLIQSS
jgi:hypothetical protein